MTKKQKKSAAIFRQNAYFYTENKITGQTENGMNQTDDTKSTFLTKIQNRISEEKTREKIVLLSCKKCVNFWE